MFSLTIERYRLFGIVNYRLFALSDLFYTVANGLVYIALSWYAYSLTHTIGSLTMLISCMWLPGIIGSPFFGVMADRFNRQQLMLYANGIRGVVIVTYSFLFLCGINPSIYFLALIYGVLGACYNTAAMPFVKQIVPQECLLLANATIDMIYESGFIIGLGVSGYLLLLINVNGVLFISGILCLLSAICIYKLSFKKQSNTKSRLNFKILINDYKLVFKYLRNHPHLLPLYLTQAMILVLMFTIPALLLPFVTSQLHGDTKVFANLELLFSAGVILGGFGSPQLVEKIGSRKTLMLLLGIMFIAIIIFSINQHIYWSYLIYPVVGIGIASWAVVLTAAQRLTLDHHQGKLQGIFYSLSGILILAIFFIQQFLNHIINVRGLYWLDGIVIVTGFLISLIWIKNH